LILSYVASETTCRETSWFVSAYGRPWIIFAESLSVIPGSDCSSVAVALLMSTTSAFGAAAVLRDVESGAFGVAGIAGAMAPEGGVGLVVVVAG
jgi:hypothetical protein